MPSKRPAPPKIDSAQAREHLLTAIKAAKEPIPIATLATLPGLGKKASGKQIDEWLAGDLEREEIYRWGKKALWNRSPGDTARQHLIAVAASEVLTAAELEKAAANQLPSVSTPTIKQAKKKLLEESRLREIAPASGPKTKRLIDTENPERYLEIEIASLLKSVGRERTLEEVRHFLASSPKPEISIRDTADKMFEAVKRTAFSPGTTVTFYRLRQQPELVDIPKAVFDKAAFLLQEEQKAILSVHDHAAALPEEEQQRFVTDGLGHFYVSIYAR